MEVGQSKWLEKCHCLPSLISKKVYGITKRQIGIGDLRRSYFTKLELH